MPIFYNIYTGSDGQHYFRLLFKNRETILQSEGYTSLKGCLNAVKSVEVNAQNPYRYEKRTANSGQLFFLLRTANGEIIGKSEMYANQGAREMIMNLLLEGASIVEYNLK